MKKSIALDINLGIGDHVFARAFLDGIKDQYDRIAITHSRPALAFWFNNDKIRQDFNLKLGKLVFSEPPYILVPNAHFPFYPNERIVKELNDKPVKPNLDHLAAGAPLDITDYIVITTKARQFPKATFDQIKDKLALSLQALAAKHRIVILGERDVQRTREYEAEVNRNQVFGIYDYLISVLPSDRIVDLSVPVLGITVSSMEQFQQDCLIFKEAKCVLTLGIGGNFWMSAAVAKKTIGLRADTEWTTDLMINQYPNMFLTKSIDEFTGFLTQLD